MVHSMKRLSAALLIAFLFGTILLPLTDQGAGQVQAAQVLSGRVTSGVQALRAGKSSKAKIFKMLHQNDQVTVFTTGSKWALVRSGDVTGYIWASHVDTGLGGTAADEGGCAKGQQVVNFALQFVGNPYRFGGTSLTNGTDCSGFVMSVYRHFGVKLPRTSSTQRKAGKRVMGLANAKPGDIICYRGHVALYLGNKQIVHASNKKTGIKITNNANYRKIVAIRRIF